MSVALDPIVAGKLRQFSRRRWRLLVLRGLCVGVVTFLLAMCIVALVDWSWLLSDRTRWLLSGAAYVLVVAAVWMTSLRRLVYRPGNEEIATYVEQLAPSCAKTCCRLSSWLRTIQKRSMTRRCFAVCCRAKWLG